MARSLNKAILIGNLTRDPELKYTPSGAAVVTFGVATNRAWKTESGEAKEDAEFHKIVAWNQLAEICAKMLKKGKRVYVEGRLQTRTWQGQDGNQRSTTEIVISDMILLDSRSDVGTGDIDVPADFGAGAGEESQAPREPEEKKSAKKASKKAAPKKEEAEEDIPF